ncbi:MAG: trigger factor [Gemmatimonadota bacterium]
MATQKRGEPVSLEVTVEQTEVWKRRLTVTVSPEQVAEARTREQARLGRSLKLKGFRKGHVPPRIVEERFGALIDQRALEFLIDRSYREALREQDLQPIAEPAFGDVQYDPGRSLTYQVELEIRPTLQLQRLGGFRIQRPDSAVSEDEVDEILQRLREEHGVLVPVDRAPRPGDVVSVRITRLDAQPAEPGAEFAGEESGEAGEATREARPAGSKPVPYRFELGGGDAIPDVESAIQTLAPGGSEVFEVSFPEDFDEREMAGSSGKLKIELLDVKEKRLPELNEEFAAEVGEFESLDALREAIRSDLREHHEREAAQAVRERLVDSIAEANPFEVPPTLVARYLEEVMEIPDGADPRQVEEARRALEPAAERHLRRHLILQRVIEQESLEATDEELEERIRAMAQRRGLEARDLRRQLAREKRLDGIRDQIATEKAFEYLEAQSTIE